MARRKTLPDSVRAKYALAERLRMLRAELYGDRGGPELARQLGLPIRTWYNYESGVTVPAEVVLKIIELTSVEPIWLLHGKGPKFRPSRPGRPEGAGGVRRLGRRPAPHGASDAGKDESSRGRPPRRGSIARTGDQRRRPAGAGDEVVLIEVNDDDREPLTRTSGPRYLAARSEWLDAERECRCIQVVGDAMAPIVVDGAYVAFSKTRSRCAISTARWSSPGSTTSRSCAGSSSATRSPCSAPRTRPPCPTSSSSISRSGPRSGRFRRVLWINTPH